MPYAIVKDKSRLGQVKRCSFLCFLAITVLCGTSVRCVVVTRLMMGFCSSSSMFVNYVVSKVKVDIVVQIVNGKTATALCLMAENRGQACVLQDL